MPSGAKLAKKAAASAELPLSALLSQVLVAFTIEFDNEAERQLPHRTTYYGSTGGLRSLWLVSLAMYANCMQHIGPDGITIGDLVRRARTRTNFRGMRRWGYITLRPAAESKSKKPDASWIVNATPGGRLAQEIWQPLFAVTENRWRERFGDDVIASLRESLQAIVSKLNPNLPDCLPILGYGLTSVPLRKKSTAKKKNNKAALREPEPPSALPLSALLSKVLLAFAIEFENESDISLAICANVLRLVPETGVSLRDLPAMSGVSKESIAMALSFLKRQGFATVATSSGSRTKILRLTPKGRKAKAAYPTLVSKIENRWELELGKAAIRALRHLLERLVGDPAVLFQGIEPHPENWRARVRNPGTLPHFPMVLHRGGYPDGS